MSTAELFPLLGIVIRSSHEIWLSSDNNGDLAGSNSSLVNDAFPTLSASDIPNCAVPRNYQACSRDGESLPNSLLAGDCC